MQARNESGVTYANPGVDLLQYSPQFPLAVAGLQPPLPPYPGVEGAYCFSPTVAGQMPQPSQPPKVGHPGLGDPPMAMASPWHNLA